MKKFDNKTICILISIAIALLLIVLNSYSFFQVFELKNYDLLLKFRKPIEQSKNIIYVEMDEDAIDSLGRWPWPRSHFATITETLFHLGARQVLFDVTFAQPSPLQVTRKATKNFLTSEKSQIQSYINATINDIKTAENIEKESVIDRFQQLNSGIDSFSNVVSERVQNITVDNDQLFADAISTQNVFIGYSFDIDTKNNLVLPEDNPFRKTVKSFIYENPNAEFKELIYAKEVMNKKIIQRYQENWNFIKQERAAVKKFAFPQRSKQNFYKAYKITPPIIPFIHATKNAGYLNGIPDEDGVLRTIPLFVDYHDHIYPHIALASAIDLLQPQTIAFDPDKFIILEGIENSARDIKIPIDHLGRTLINWTGTWEHSFDHISAAEIYRLSFHQQEKESDNKFDVLSKRIKDKICIIGLTAPGTHDYNPIPYEAIYPMVGTHGNVLNSILTDQFIHQVPTNIIFIGLIFLSLILGVFLSRLSSLHGLIFTIFIIVGTASLSQIAINKSYWIPSVSFYFLSFFSYLGITTFRYSAEEKEKRWVKEAFSQYVSKAVMDEILEDPANLQLGGERKTLTVMFSDIRGFTTLSEAADDPQDIVSILNEYLDAMTKIIIGQKGTLDKYVGDEIMAIFGAPKYEPPAVSAKQAVQTACVMMDKLKELQAKWKAEGKQILDMGIGINTGDMVVGNMGSDLRKDYTVIGDAVNLGARIEALTRQFNCHIIVSESTYEHIKDMAITNPLESIKVKGKEIPVMMYAVEGLKAPSF